MGNQIIKASGNLIAVQMCNLVFEAVCAYLYVWVITTGYKQALGKPSHWVCKPEYLVPVPCQDKTVWRWSGNTVKDNSSVFSLVRMR